MICISHIKSLNKLSPKFLTCVDVLKSHHFGNWVMIFLIFCDFCKFFYWWFQGKVRENSIFLFVFMKFNRKRFFWKFLIGQKKLLTMAKNQGLWDWIDRNKLIWWFLNRQLQNISLTMVKKVMVSDGSITKTFFNHDEVRDCEIE